jgi:hypothetical protein
MLTGCPTAPPPDDLNGGLVYNNTTDRTNNGADYVGSAACSACHPEIAAEHDLHAHAHMLNPVTGQAPTFPAEADRAGVPDPPEGVTWSDVRYVIGGYLRKARFVDSNGFTLTNDANGVDTQWNLASPANGSSSGFVPYENDGHFSSENPKPYDHSCFQCHTTGPKAQDTDDPRFQDNLPGQAGTWQEAGVQCEACHGPGSNHVPNPGARDLYVDNRARFCSECHNRRSDADGSTIVARDGFIEHEGQFPEMRGSGGHAAFDCVICHSPHASPNYDQSRAIRNDCMDCHGDQNMALHAGKSFVRGDYTEALRCESCHMPYATRSASHAGPEVVGDLGRMADVRTHIFRINTDPTDYTGMFTDDLQQVRKDDQGRAAVTVDFVCLRCHNGVGSAFPLSVESASNVALGMHRFSEPSE